MRGLDDFGASKREVYEDENFKEEIARLYQEIRPLYIQIHAYVRHRLHKFYGPDKVGLSAPIPVHLLGDSWGQKMYRIPDITTPFPHRKPQEYDAVLRKQGYTTHKMVRMADEFYQSLNMSAMTDKFWKYSMFEKPQDRKVKCKSREHLIPREYALLS